MQEEVVETELRKEVFDYLRQLQKREEQSAKLSGMNSWVLVAAMCYLAAWLLDHSTALATEKNILTGVSVGLCILFLQLLVRPANAYTSTSDTRLKQFISDDTSSTGLNIFLFGLAPILPTIASFLLFGWSFPVIYGLIMALILLMAFVVGPFIKKIVRKNYYRSVNHTNVWSMLFAQLVTLAALWVHTKQLFSIYAGLQTDHLIFSAYVTALWWASWQLLVKFNSAAKINEYAHLEEALMFGVASPREILRKLELQKFGPSLEKELSTLEENIETAHNNYIAALDIFKRTVDEIKQVPSEYQHEKDARIKNAFLPFSKIFHTLLDAVEEKVDYIASFLTRKSSSFDSNVRELLKRESENLKKRTAFLRAENNTIRGDISALASKEFESHLSVQEQANKTSPKK